MIGWANFFLIVRSNCTFRMTEVDQQVGLVQKILCDKPEYAHLNSCHMLEGTMCHLLNHCGDKRNRFDYCSFDFDIQAVLYPLSISLSNRRKLIICLPIILGTLMFYLAVLPDLL